MMSGGGPTRRLVINLLLCHRKHMDPSHGSKWLLKLQASHPHSRQQEEQRMKEGYSILHVVSHLASHLATPYCKEAWEV